MQIETPQRSLTSSLLLLLGIWLLSYVLGNVIGGVLMVLIAQLNISNLSDLNGAILSSKNGWWAMIVAQGVASFTIFIVAGLFYWFVIEKKKFSDFNFKKFPSLTIYLNILLAQLAFMPFNGTVQSINEKMDLPSFLDPIEKFMKTMEESMASTTEFLTNFTSPVQFFFAFLVIAVVAGIGEELLFRGILQRKMMEAFKNPHLAIWVTAFIFSAIHMQFYGFLPRVFLGAMFGYFYYWTGNLWVPIVSHIINNGLAVTLLYLTNLKKVSPEIEKMDKVAPQYALLSLLIFGGFMYFTHKEIFKKEPTS